MEVVEDVVIVGAGVAGLSTALGLHRQGIRSLVLESWGELRLTGFAFATWTNAWKALEALGIADSLRKQHASVDGIISSSLVSGQRLAELNYNSEGPLGQCEIRCLKRVTLLQALAKELPSGSIKFSSKVVFIEDSGYFKLLHLADGSIIKTKVLIGCDGVNSVVAKWLGLKTPTFVGRSAIRGCAEFNGNSHGFDRKYLNFVDNGIRSGFLSCQETSVYWFFTWTPSAEDKDMEDNPEKMKQYVLRRLEKVPDKVRAAVEATQVDSIQSSNLRYRHPWDLLWGNISKGNVCVAGDALHPMTPDLAQGACAALEDGVVLARCLGEALLKKGSGMKTTGDELGEEEEEEYHRIEMGLQKYSNLRRWRSIDLIFASFVVGFMQHNDGKLIRFLQEKLGKFTAMMVMKKSEFDCGNLLSS